MRFVRLGPLLWAWCVQIQATGLDSECKEDPNLGLCSPSDQKFGHVFEGVEKRIEIFFELKDDNVLGLRTIERPILDEVCTEACCTIIHHEKTDCFDAYILSESSLFIFRDRAMMKTCGTTVPLLAVEYLIKQARRVGVQPVGMTYSRSSFLFPELQLYPHRKLDDEIEYLESMTLDGFSTPGATFVLGNSDDKYWLVHRKQLSETLENVPVCRKKHQRVMVDCIMTGISSEARERYFKDTSKSDSENQEIMSNSLQSILPEFKEIVGKCYEPCGYSCNAQKIMGDEGSDRYFTVHITPEEAFSYASVEAVFHSGDDVDLVQLGTDITRFVENVARVFGPKDIAVTMLASNGSVPVLPSRTEMKVDHTTYDLVNTGRVFFGEDSGRSDMVAVYTMYSTAHQSPLVV